MRHRPEPYRPTKAGIFAIVCILVLLLLGGWIEVKADVVIAVPADGEKQRDSSTVIVQDNEGGQTMIHCLSTETGLIYCIEL